MTFGDREADEDAFRSLFREEYPAMVRLAYLLVGDPTTAEDVAQEAFARAFSQWSKVSTYERPGAWLRRIAIRIAMRTERNRRKERLLTSEPPETTSSSTYSDLRGAILELPPAQRSAIVLHYFEGRPLAEVASILGCRTPTAKVHVHRARKQLERALGEMRHVSG